MSDATDDTPESGSSDGGSDGETGNEGDGDGDSMTDATGDGDGDGGPKLDVAIPPLLDLPPEIGCEHVDLLFVFDNSGSMGPHQEELIATFDYLRLEIQDKLFEGDDTKDVQIGVTGTDDVVHGCEDYCPNSPTACQNLVTPPLPLLGVDLCDMSLAETELFACEHELGTLERMPTGQGSSNELCFDFGDPNYIDSTFTADQAGEAFDCSARLGVAGSGNERLLGPMGQAIAPNNNAPGGCNEGFVRSNSILGVAFLTNSPDDGTLNAGLAAAFVQEWVGFERLSILAILPQGGNPVVNDFLDELPQDQVVLADIEAANYEAAIDEWILPLQALCDEFEPQQLPPAPNDLHYGPLPSGDGEKGWYVMPNGMPFSKDLAESGNYASYMEPMMVTKGFLGNLGLTGYKLPSDHKFFYLPALSGIPQDAIFYQLPWDYKPEIHEGRTIMKDGFKIDYADLLSVLDPDDSDQLVASDF